MAQLIDGKMISQQIKDELKEKVSAFKADGKEIGMAVIQVGNDPASSVYVGNTEPHRVNKNRKVYKNYTDYEGGYEEITRSCFSCIKRCSTLFNF